MASEATPLDENSGQRYLDELIPPAEGLGSFGKSVFQASQERSRSPASVTQGTIKEESGKSKAQVVSVPSKIQNFSFDTPQTLNFKNFDVNQEFANIDSSIAKMQQTRQNNLADLIAKKQALLKGVEVATDLRPLAMLVDAWTGTKFTSQYIKPKDVEERLAQVAQIDQQAKADQEQIAGLDLEKAKMKIQLAIQAEKAKSDNLIKSINALSQIRGLGIKEEGQANQLEIARLRLEQQQNKLKPIPQGELEKINAGKVAFDQMKQLNDYLFKNHDPNNPDKSKTILGSPIMRTLLKFPNIPFKSALKTYAPMLLDQLSKLDEKDLLRLDKIFQIKDKLKQEGNFINEAAYVESVIASIAQNYAKAKEGGVLREYDEKFKYENMLANLSESPKLFFAKWKVMMDEVARNYDERYNYYSKAKTNYDMSNLRPLREGNEFPQGKYEFGIGLKEPYPSSIPKPPKPPPPPQKKKNLMGDKLLKMSPEEQKAWVENFKKGNQK